MNGKVFLFTRKCRAGQEHKVLEVGSLDVNGAIRENFKGAGEYVGIDIRPGTGVDKVLSAEDLPIHFKPGYFDLVMCCETLEHCERWKECLRGMWAVLKVGGRICITTPTQEKGRHNYPNDYWRWTLDDYRAIFKDQSIERCEMVYERGVGIIADKLTDSLFLDVEPYAVP